jgi:hypothetical protein
MNYPTVGDMQEYEFLRGIIVSIDAATDTCTVDVCSVGVVTALLFYHCEPDSPLRDNGAIEGAAAGFAEEDEVIVQVKHDKSEARVIAHIDGVRPCGWKFILTLGNGEHVDDSYVIYFNVQDSLSNYVQIEYSYIPNEKEPPKGYWSITFKDKDAPKDPNGYWVSYVIAPVVTESYEITTPTTQYPYRYLDADRRKPEDLIQPRGTYEDTIPYAKIVQSTDPVPEEIGSLSDIYPAMEQDFAWTDYGLVSDLRRFIFKNDPSGGIGVKLKLTVYASVPIKLTYFNVIRTDPEWNVSVKHNIPDGWFPAVIDSITPSGSCHYDFSDGYSVVHDAYAHTRAVRMQAPPSHVFDLIPPNLEGSEVYIKMSAQIGDCTYYGIAGRFPEYPELPEYVESWTATPLAVYWVKSRSFNTISYTYEFLQD